MGEWCSSWFWMLTLASGRVMTNRLLWWFFWLLTLAPEWVMTNRLLWWFFWLLTLAPGRVITNRLLWWFFWLLTLASVRVSVLPFNGSNVVFITRSWASDIVRAFMSVTSLLSLPSRPRELIYDLVHVLTSLKTFSAVKPCGQKPFRGEKSAQHKIIQMTLTIMHSIAHPSRPWSISCGMPVVTRQQYL